MLNKNKRMCKDAKYFDKLMTSNFYFLQQQFVYNYFIKCYFYFCFFLSLISQKELRKVFTNIYYLVNNKLSPIQFTINIISL